MTSFKSPTTVEEASDWLIEALGHIGPSFHPDTPANVYIAATGAPLFNEADAQAMDLCLAQCRSLLVEPSATIVDRAREVIFRRPTIAFATSVESRRYGGHLHPPVYYAYIYLRTPGAPWGEILEPRWDPKPSWSFVTENGVQRQQKWKYIPKELRAASAQYIKAMQIDYELRAARGAKLDANTDYPMYAEAKAFLPSPPKCHPTD